MSCLGKCSIRVVLVGSSSPSASNPSPLTGNVSGGAVLYVGGQRVPLSGSGNGAFQVAQPGDRGLVNLNWF